MSFFCFPQGNDTKLTSCLYVKWNLYKRKMKEMKKAFHETCGKKKQFLLHKCLILKIIYFFQKVQCSFCSLTLLTSHRGSDSGPPVICQTCWLFLLKMPVQGGSTIDQCNQGPMLQRAHQVLCRENTFRSIPVTERRRLGCTFTGE